MRYRYMNITKALLAVLTASVLFSPPLTAQQEGEDVRAGGLNVYLECGARGCESSHYRTEITFVNWVQEVQDAQLHVIMTSTSSGSGDLYQLDFIGREEMEGMDDQLTYSHSNTDTDFERSQGLTGVLAVGLARYSVLAGREGPFTVNLPVGSGGSRRPELPPGLQGEVDDPWDYWVFNIRGNVQFDEQDLRSEKEYSGNFSANRTTEMWKITFSGRGSYNDQEGEYSNGTKYENVQRSGSFDGRVFYSLSERWSAGLEAGASTSTRNNQDFAADVGTGVEYSFFPYRDWTRRRMTLQTLIYARYFDYELETQFNKMTETVMEGALRWGLGFRQPWGTAYVNATAEAYLHDPQTFHRLSIGGRLEFRITRGLDWNIGGEISRIRDQIYIPLESLSDEDILLGRRQLPTDSELRVSTGFSFSFGSIYNNVVNNRFGFMRGGGGRGMFF